MKVAVIRFVVLAAAMLGTRGMWKESAVEVLDADSGVKDIGPQAGGDKENLGAPAAHSAPSAFMNATEINLIKLEDRLETGKTCDEIRKRKWCKKKGKGASCDWHKKVCYENAATFTTSEKCSSHGRKKKCQKKGCEWVNKGHCLAKATTTSAPSMVPTGYDPSMMHQNEGATMNSSGIDHVYCDADSCDCFMLTTADCIVGEFPQKHCAVGTINKTSMDQRCMYRPTCNEDYCDCYGLNNFGGEDMCTTGNASLKCLWDVPPGSWSHNQLAACREQPQCNDQWCQCNGFTAAECTVGDNRHKHCVVSTSHLNGTVHQMCVNRPICNEDYCECHALTNLGGEAMCTTGNASLKCIWDVSPWSHNDELSCRDKPHCNDEWCQCYGFTAAECTTGDFRHKHCAVSTFHHNESSIMEQTCENRPMCNDNHCDCHGFTNIGGEAMCATGNASSKCFWDQEECHYRQP